MFKPAVFHLFAFFFVNLFVLSYSASAQLNELILWHAPDAKKHKVKSVALQLNFFVDSEPNRKYIEVKYNTQGQMTDSIAPETGFLKIEYEKGLPVTYTTAYIDNWSEPADTNVWIQKLTYNNKKQKITESMHLEGELRYQRQFLYKEKHLVSYKEFTTDPSTPTATGYTFYDGDNQIIQEVGYIFRPENNQDSTLAYQTDYDYSDDGRLIKQHIIWPLYNHQEWIYESHYTPQLELKTETEKYVATYGSNDATQEAINVNRKVWKIYTNEKGELLKKIYTNLSGQLTEEKKKDPSDLYVQKIQQTFIYQNNRIIESQAAFELRNTAAYGIYDYNKKGLLERITYYEASSNERILEVDYQYTFH